MKKWENKNVKHRQVGYNLRENYPSLFECSICGWECDDTTPGLTQEYNYCPYCGAKIISQKDGKGEKNERVY